MPTRRSFLRRLAGAACAAVASTIIDITTLIPERAKEPLYEDEWVTVYEVRFRDPYSEPPRYHSTLYDSSWNLIG